MSPPKKENLEHARLYHSFLNAVILTSHFIVIHRLILNTMKIPIQTLTDHQLNNQREKDTKKRATCTFGPRRVTMPIRRTLAVRSKFHNIPLELAPPPNDPIPFHEHSYAQSINNKLLYSNYLHFGGTTR